MSNRAAILAHGLLQYHSSPSSQLKALRQVWPVISKEKNVQPSLFVNILKVCSKIGHSALSNGEIIHNHLNMVTSPPIQNAVVWNSLISMYTRCGAPHKALQIWKDHMRTIAPDKFTHSCVLSACAAVSGDEGLRVGREIHTQLQRMPYRAWDATLFTSLVNMYVKCSRPADAILLWKVSHHFHVHGGRGTLKCFLKACAEVGSAAALEIGHEIHVYIRTLPRSEVDTALHNALINMLWKCGDAAGAVAHWDHLVTTRALDVNPQIATTALLACAQVGPASLERGMSIHKLADYPQARQNPLFVSALIGMYSKCGDVGAALCVWDAFEQWCTSHPHATPFPHLDVVCAAALGACGMVEPVQDSMNLAVRISHFAQSHGLSPLYDLRLCNALMLTYAKCGAGDAAIQIWHEIKESKKLIPNAHTYLAILAACASKGQMAHALGSSICTQMQLDPADGEQTVLNVYGAVIHMYGKCGSWQEAECVQLVPYPHESVTEHMQRNVGWYGEHGQGTKARDLFAWMLASNIRPSWITFVNLLNAYAHSGLVEDALQVFESMKSNFSI